MLGREHRLHELLAELVPLGPLGPARLRLGVLEAHSRVQPTVRHRRAQLLARRLGRLDLEVRPQLPQPRDRGRDDGGEGARERADPQRVAIGRRQLGDLPVGLREPVGHGVRVGEQHRAGLGRRRPARPPLQEPDAELSLERRDLL